ncbi:hypothetical protein BN961_01526 [Afipia felis]|uniref:Uncharacterized protein n=1 Tax=Afipia felis TaxID=1035 RepID=A0A090MKX1_AFIFE|nr:hypothetical protein BN961_01526 [Afipia felis]
MDDVARVDLTQAGAACQRGHDLGVAERGLRVVDGGLIGLHQRLELGDCRPLGIGPLRGTGLGSSELLVTLQIDPRIGELR